MREMRAKPKIRRRLVLPCATALAAVLSLGTARAELVPIDVDGDGSVDAVYDSTTDLSWLADGALYATNSFGLPISPGQGSLDWQTANEWLAAMNAQSHLGVDDWRLPAVSPVNGSSFVYEPQVPGQTYFNGTIDQIANITSPASELSYLYYVSLGNVGLYPTNHVGGVPVSPPGYSPIPQQGPFVNFLSDVYWTGTPFAGPLCGASCVWAFGADTGVQGGYRTDGPGIATWAVRNGRVPVPEAAGRMLLLSGMGLVSVLARRRR